MASGSDGHIPDPEKVPSDPPEPTPGPDPAAEAREEWRAYARVIAKVWADPEFERLLRAQPEATLREAGIQLPVGSNVRILPVKPQDPGDEFYFILPPKPPRLDDELTPELMRQAMVGIRAMGTTHSCCGSGRCHACGCDSKG